jgi:hypothetical protein
VLTGVTDAAGAVLAPPHQRPTYISFDLAGLVEPQPAVSSGPDGFACGGWTARWSGDQLELSGDGTRLDGLRALCAAAWSRDDTPADAVQHALSALPEK